jgi:hypothetical protein
MIPAIIYPVPLDNWETFKPDVERFCSTWKEFEPGCECDLFFQVPSSNFPPDSFMRLIDSSRTYWVPYEGNGADIGAHQHFAHAIRDRVMVCLSARVHFHRAGWLKRLVDVWDEFGPGLYGTAATREPGKLCLRTHCYMIRSDDFQAYPHVINTRSRGHFFEWGDGNPDGSFTSWYRNRGGHTRVVYWDSTSDMEWLAQDNIFRRGDQSNLLVWDRHTKLWADSSPHHQRVLSTMCFGLDTRENEV